VLPGMPLLVDAYNDLQAYTLRRGVGTVWREHEVFWRHEMRGWQPYAIARGTGALPPDAVTARGAIGVSGYYTANLVLIDQKGLTDRHVARSATDRPNEQRYMAHDRYASMEYLFARGFNVHLERAATSRHQALMTAPFALRISDEVWMPFSSRLPDWVETAFGDRPLWGWKTVAQVGCFRAGADSGWTLEGPAFSAGARTDVPPTRTIQWAARCAPDAGLSSRDAQGGGSGQGTVRSPLFRIPEGAAIEARLFGPRSDRCDLRVVDAEGRLLSSVRAGDESAAAIVHLDLSPWAGQEARVELFDGSDEGWIGALAIVLLEPRRMGA